MEQLNRSNENKDQSLLQRTEEVQHIIDRMPDKFGKVIAVIVIFVFALLLLFGWLIRYPDVSTGQISISANHSPVKLVAAQSGKIRLSELQSQEWVTEGQIVAWLENPALPADVEKVANILDSMILPTTDAFKWYNRLPRRLVLGELTSKYFTFLNSLKQLADYQHNKLYDKQSKALDNLLLQQWEVLRANVNKADISSESLDLVNRQGKRDSTLHKRKMLSDAEMDRSRLSAVTAEDSYQAALRDVANAREQIGHTQSKLQELHIQWSEKKQQLDLELLTAYNHLRDNLSSWEQQYLFRAPFGGRVQFLDFWKDGQFVQSGEKVFTIVPKQEKIIGQVVLPAAGAGKVEKGQEAIVKLDDYPYMEYGSVTGYVESISLTTNSIRSEQGEVEMYLITISFPKQLETNYGEQVGFRHEIKGSIEIITRKRRLIQRLFDNLKYIIKE